ncbi:MAG TPA: carboxypeptidase regulatory-like domain-containing protein [Candidatus Binatia bacterium]
MFKKHHPTIAITIAALAIFLAQVVTAQERAGSLQGVIKDTKGAPVVGAYVKMKNPERRVTFMVVSQSQGRYSVNNLPSGKYLVQSIGGEFQSELSAPVEVAAGKLAMVDLALTVARAPQLPGAWPGRLPGEVIGEGGEGAPPLPDGEGKAIVETKCVTCHDSQRIARVQANQERWQIILRNMATYAQGSTAAKTLTEDESQTVLAYVMANFSGNGGTGRPAPDPNSRLPRTLVQGEAAKYLAVEYELPNNKVEPHEIAVDLNGNAWVTQRVGGKLGRLDPKNYSYTELAPPAGASPTNRLNAITRAGDGKLWFIDGGPNRRWLSIDPKTKEFEVYELPKLKSGSASGNTMRVHPNGTVWLNSIAANQVIRLDPKNREFSVYDVPAGVKRGRTASPYGMSISGDGKIWFVENAVNQLGRLDPATGKIDEYEIFVKNPVARKSGMDSAGNVWVGLHGAGKLMKVDYKTTKMTVYEPPTEDAGPYSIQGDPKSQLVWFSEQHVDQMARFDPKSERFTEFALANAESDPRRIEVDPTNPNRIWWSGNLSGRMGYIELLK